MCQTMRLSLARFLHARWANPNTAVANDRRSVSDATDSEHRVVTTGPRLIWIRLATATGLTIAALLLAILLRPLIAPNFFAIFIAAVVGSAWYGGLLAGLFATVLSTIMINFVLFEPDARWSDSRAALWRLATFLGAAVTVAALAGGRRAAEGALRRSEEHYRLIVQTVSEGVWLISANGRTQFTNRRMADLLGVTVEDLHDRDVFSLVDTARVPNIRSRLQRVAEGRRDRFDVPFFHRDGHEVLVSVSASPVQTTGAHDSAISLICTDVTTLRRVERERDRARDRAAKLLDVSESLSHAMTTPEIVARVLANVRLACGADGASVSLLDAESQTLSLAGSFRMPKQLSDEWSVYPASGRFPLADALRANEPVWISGREDWASKFPETVQDFDRSGFGAMCSLPLVLKGHPIGELSLDFRTARAFPPDERAFLRAIGHQTAQALERARLFEAEAAARSSALAAEAKYRALFEGSADVVVVIDAHGVITEWNRAAGLLFGSPNLADRLFMDSAVFPPHEQPDLCAIPADVPWEAEHEIRCSDGSCIPVETRAIVTGTASDRSIIASLRDVTRRREVEQAQLSLIANVTHDIKSPIAAISAQTQYMLRRLRHGKPIEGEMLETKLSGIVETCTHMSDVVDELVEVARVRLGHPIQLQLSRSDLKDVLLAEVERHNKLLPEPRIEFKGTVPKIEGVWDRNRLARVFDNLLENALKYSPSGSPIAVRLDVIAAADESQIACVVVEDHGIGIPRADLPHIFDQFRRGTNAAGRIGGSGIGLAGVRQIVERHGGRVEVESQEGKGSVFRVLLPCIPTEPGANARIGPLESDLSALMARWVHGESQHIGGLANPEA